ncbi:MAG: FAD-dependent oxidoreductase [Flavobacteriaceae bacterium]|nr:FAD-dependent oxidoreductase [Flavobacteriaceae bacterium]
MNRTKSLSKITSNKEWDIVIIGGGASGIGTAIDSASRGHKTLLIEKYDFSKGTSSRSTKLIHGGVRYLQNGDVSLVIEALKERGILRSNAPHLVKDLSFVIPSYDWWSSPFYGIGLKIYDMMSGDFGIGTSTIIDKEETEKLIPNVNKKGLKGGVIYFDGQFDDSRMAISLAQTAENYGATIINYFEAIDLIKSSDNSISGLRTRDLLKNRTHEIKSKVIINATGVFSDSVMKMDNQKSLKMIQPSQGVHIVLEKKFLNSDHAIMVPHTTDGRVLFAVPWHKYVILGTTDTTVNTAKIEPQALNEEIDFIISNAGKYMTTKPKKKDIKSIFVGLRPLARIDNSQTTKEISRHHKINISTSGLISILGGKWTTYRKIGEDATNSAEIVGGLKRIPSKTKKIKIHGYKLNPNFDDPLYIYGSDKNKILNISSNRDSNRSLSKELFITKNQILWAIRYEMAITLEDILARRTRCLFLNVVETEKLVDEVLSIMAKELKKDGSWMEQQKLSFLSLSKKYKL